MVCAPNRFAVSIDARSMCAWTLTLSRTATVALTNDSAAVGRCLVLSLAML